MTEFKVMCDNVALHLLLIFDPVFENLIMCMLTIFLLVMCLISGHNMLIVVS